MEIPNCYDPVRQAERREYKWDRYLKQLPVCAICGKTIMPGHKIHAARNTVACTGCVEDLSENYDFVEEPNEYC